MKYAEFSKTICGYWNYSGFSIGGPMKTIPPVSDIIAHLNGKEFRLCGRLFTPDLLHFDPMQGLILWWSRVPKTNIL